LPLAREHAQLSQITWRNEAGPKQAKPAKRGEPLAIHYVGFSARHLLDVAGVDNKSFDAFGFQGAMNTFPLNTGALHYGKLDAVLLEPTAELTSVLAEGPKLFGFLGNYAICLLRLHGGHDYHFMHIQSGATFDYWGNHSRILLGCIDDRGAGPDFRMAMCQHCGAGLFIVRPMQNNQHETVGGTCRKS
jgi:hypothetical protein